MSSTDTESRVLRFDILSLEMCSLFRDPSRLRCGLRVCIPRGHPVARYLHVRARGAKDCGLGFRVAGLMIDESVGTPVARVATMPCDETNETLMQSPDTLYKHDKSPGMRHGVLRPRRVR